MDDFDAFWERNGQECLSLAATGHEDLLNDPAWINAIKLAMQAAFSSGVLAGISRK